MTCRPTAPSTKIIAAGLCLSGLFLMSCGITVEGADDDEFTVSPATPTVAPTPLQSIEIEPEALRFGSVELGQSVTLAVGFLNKGTETLHVEKVDFYTPVPFFAMASVSNQTLGPGESIQVYVTFSPGQTGNFNATMDLVTTESNLPPVNVSGRGVPVDTTDDTPASSPEPTPGP